jgi:ribosomal protein L33
MAKKNQKRKIVRLVAASGAAYYTTRRADGEKLMAVKKFDNKTRQVEEFNEYSKSLGRNEVKKRK